MTHPESIWRHASVFAPSGGGGGADSGAGDSGAGDSGAGDSGAGGNVAGGPIAAAPGVSIGLSPSRPLNDGTYRGDRWPPSNIDPKVLHITKRTFSDRSWNDYYAAIAILTEFVALKTAPPGTVVPNPAYWNTISLATPVQDDDAFKAELAELADLVEYRPGLMAEALAQRGALVRYWQTMLAFNSGSHPATTRLMEVCLRIAQFTAMYYKKKFHRPRPSQISPWLLPPVAVPGHASYPSGHATEASLQAQCLKQVLSDAAAGSPAAYNAADLAAINLMADRVARNREVMGLHYPSDSAAGVVLATALMPMLKACPTIVALIAEAAAEWKRVVV